MLKRQRPLDGISQTQAAMLKHLRRRGAASRAEIAEMCGVTAAAVSMMTRDLIERGIVIEGARRQSGRGAPQIDLMLDAGIGYALGIHANRYTLSLVLLDFRGSRLDERQLHGEFDSFDQLTETIGRLTGELLAENSIDRRFLIGAGIAMPTRFGRGTAKLDLAQEVISWSGSDITAPLIERLECPVIIENDANAAAMGELTLGNHAGHQNFAYLYLSEGIGSGLIIGQELYRGNVGNAGEIGALRARGLSRPSFADLADWCRKRVGHIPSGRSSDVWNGYLLQHKDVLDEWLSRAGPETARLAFMIAAILAPSAIYIGGTLPSIVRKRLADWLDFARSKPFAEARVLQPEIRIPEIDDADTVALGAAAMILHGLPHTY